MSTRLKMVDADISVFTAARLMGAAGTDEVVLVSDGQVAGVVTAHDIALRLVGAGLSPYTTPALAIAMQDVPSIEETTTVNDAIQLMGNLDTVLLLVTDRDWLVVGTLHAADLHSAAAVRTERAAPSANGSQRSVLVA